ncbi:YitT family protein [Acutalibacter sp.]|uniref:YitT family protein n=1 Tax=Acutalibacter sp. TaxID=1918636 RepID=UPI00217043D0|nr:YitT family protein [Acutalibacter sp.]
MDFATLKAQLKTLKPRNFLLLTLAGMVNAVGVTLFIAPVELYDSGVSGTSILFSQVTPPFLSLSFFLLVLNIPLFLFGLKRQGAAFTVYATYSVLVYAVSAFLITDVLPVDVSLASPLAGTDLLLCALFGGMISGMGSGLAIRFGGAMDGVEVLAVIFAKRLGLTVGTFVMVYNVVLYILCGIVRGSWVLPLYSIVTYMAALKTVDFIVEGIDRSKAAMIVTGRQEEVCAALSETFGCGVTIFPVTGYYSGDAKCCAYIILNRFQIGRMKELVHEYDPGAYITITEVADVFTNTAQHAKK